MPRHSPSRTGQADLPHPALQAMGRLSSCERPPDLRMRTWSDSAVSALLLASRGKQAPPQSWEAIGPGALSPIGHYASLVRPRLGLVCFHGSASLCSTGMTPLRRSYGGSVTFRARLFGPVCQAMNSVAVPGS